MYAIVKTVENKLKSWKLVKQSTLKKLNAKLATKVVFVEWR